MIRQIIFGNSKSSHLKIGFWLIFYYTIESHKIYEKEDESLKYPSVLQGMNFNRLKLKAIERKDEQLYIKECFKQRDFEIFINVDEESMSEISNYKDGEKYRNFSLT